MLMPKRVKRRKQFRGTMKGTPSRGVKITYGEYGLVAQEPCWIKSNQIEAARVALTRYLKRGGKVWIDIFPDKPVTAQPAETRMGSGKGAVDYWVAVVKPGRVLFEVAGVPEEDAREALRLAMHKLPCTCKIMSRAQTNGPDDVYVPREWKAKRQSVAAATEEGEVTAEETAAPAESAEPAAEAVEEAAEGGEES